MIPAKTPGNNPRGGEPQISGREGSARPKQPASHTPGPWQAVVGNGAGSFWNIHQKTPTIDGGYFCKVEALHTTEQAIGTARANARLIASAPDLLIACLAAQRALRATSAAVKDYSHELAVLKGAIEKAEGRTGG